MGITIDTLLLLQTLFHCKLLQTLFQSHSHLQPWIQTRDNEDRTAAGSGL